jgi:hypothetical protein
MPDLVERPAVLDRVEWGAIFAGAVTAAALAFILHAFASTVGLAVSSTAPTWRDASIGLWILSGVYLVVVALASYGLGGYVAGLLRTRHAAPRTSEETEFSDNLHGLLVWAVATLITVATVILLASASARLAAPSGGGAGSGNSVASENTIAYDIDRLLRGDRRPNDTDVAATRSEVGRILLTASGHRGVTAEDRAYLSRFIAARTGLGAPEAEKRVDAAIASVKENLSRARKSTTILAFMAGAAALLGAVAAWFAAALGGQQRDDVSASGRWNYLGRRNV